MLQLIIGLAAHFAGAFLLMFAYDSGAVWCESESIRLRIPSVLDIDSSNIGLVDLYVKHEICPAYHYFVLRNDLTEKPERGSFLTGVFFQIPSMIISLRGIMSLPNMSRQAATPIIVASCVIGVFLVHLLYRRLLKIERYSYGEFEFSKDVEHLSRFKREYGESLDAATNNLAIHRHLQYLMSIQDSLRMRKAVRKVLTVFAIIAYILLVPINP